MENEPFMAQRFTLDGTAQERHFDQKVTGITEKDALLKAMRILAAQFGPASCPQCSAHIDTDAGETECPNGCCNEDE